MSDYELVVLEEEKVNFLSHFLVLSLIKSPTDQLHCTVTQGQTEQLLV